MPREENRGGGVHHGQNLLLTAAVGVVGGLVGFFFGWYQNQQEERPQQQSQQQQQQTGVQSEEDHQRWLKVIENLENRVTELDSYDCVVCFENRRNVIFNCEHLVVCAACASKLDYCPMCRQKIRVKQTVRLFT